MQLLFLSKGSTQIGLGHVIRSSTLASEAYYKGSHVESIIIGDKVVDFFAKQAPFKCELIENESQLKPLVQQRYDAIILDLLEIDIKWIEYLKKYTDLLVSISPIFSQMAYVDILFNRTKYVPKHYDSFSIKQYLGLEYSIIQKNCVKIDTEDYQENLQRDVLSIALCMGGGDAGNKTLTYLKHLTKCPTPSTFWVLLGEGYRHSYDHLVSTIESEKDHEVILAKTNKSMWHILKNCVAIILPGGITTYEAIHAGLPTINTFEREEQYFLIRELVENGVSMNAGLSTDENLSKICTKIDHINSNREELLSMHQKAQQLIDGSGGTRILNIIEQHVNGS